MTHRLKEGNGQRICPGRSWVGGYMPCSFYHIAVLVCVSFLKSFLFQRANQNFHLERNTG